MPLDEYLRETMTLLQNDPDATEILVERVKPLRSAERGEYEQFFQTRNDAFMKARAAEMPGKH